MKRVFTLFVCLAMLAVSVMGFAGCSKKEILMNIPVYMCSETFNFDPATAYTDQANAQILSMLYEGLFKYDSKGNVVNGMCSSYTTFYKPEENYYMVQFNIRGSSWSDGRSVQAQDFVYAFKRIIEPEFLGEGAAMLYSIKNARAVKAGDMSIDDFGVYAASKKILQIEFEEEPDLDLLFEYLASPLLVPMREDCVQKSPTDWSSNKFILTTNGPYVIRTILNEASLALENNDFYYAKYPFRLVANYAKTPEENLNLVGEAVRIPGETQVDEKGREIFETDNESQPIIVKTDDEFYNEKYVAYDGNLPLDKRTEYADKVSTADTMCEMNFLFNTDVKPFDKKEVRQALSIALDRQAIADLIVYAKPATGFITNKVKEAGKLNNKMFRDVGGELISPSANVEEAKNLLKKAGVSKGSFTLTIHDCDEVDLAVAEYAVKVWKELGFAVTINKLGPEEYEDNDYDLIRDHFQEAYAASDFDVILLDTTMASTDAFATLAQYAVSFAGGKIDLTQENTSLVPHIGGYDSKDYDALIEKAFAEKDRATRAGILHEAEAMLIDDAPIAPVIFYQNAYITNKDLSKVSTTYYGFPDFSKANLANYEYYVDTEPLVTQEIATAITTGEDEK